VISAPALYRYVLDQLDLTDVLIRFIIAVPIARCCWPRCVS
jgi:hypothetical protein